MPHDTSKNAAAGPTEKSDDEPKKEPIMSRAARRRAKKPQVTVTSEMRQAARERLRELRRHLRLLKSNGARRKVAKAEAKKRERETTEAEEVCARLDVGARPLKKSRRE
ncbi:hypothetical protein C3747_88g296c [Trypanosoma cruzi]|uniref:Uncharacterized protein n=2 Tax=Trypanosoma cruzi TaxID=5693 RepID=Q4CV56_TRYCC|nr:hypothetical protein, conserved [Trypanosoma cruzi]EAN84159.1 hypothetical protein, conserved [Trypanosoma cruzi]KAF8298041.1 hypothetical protein TcYC6_0075690 [Trypanosoma cruzi]PWV08636.1 hypothetical protein C3747_88g296c [Trypanosoma cruzi]RNC55071.1 hypothetical protein TcCL_ESM07481 [Trypanosoma cruzi]|eukprot:XP_806010.1 hypothetical protein [Trypanosoma cruzi strain CL Brener]